MKLVQRVLMVASSTLCVSKAKADMASSASDVNRNLNIFNMAAIRHAYQNPSDAKRQIRSGRLQRLCEKEVRGY
jgi:hypothetical protein